jgi:2'-5' RNA ligase
MQLHAAIVPPPDAVRSALDAAHALFSPPAAPVEQPRRGVLGRLRRPAPAAAAATPVMSFFPATPGAEFVTLAKLGNVTVTDASVLVKALAEAATDWTSPLVRVSTLSVGAINPRHVVPALDVHARLEGEVDALQTMFRSLNDVARAQRFFLDRRSFRPEFPLGFVEATEGGTIPEALPGSTSPHESEWWCPTHVTILRSLHSYGGTTYEEFERVKLPQRQGDSSLCRSA